MSLLDRAVAFLLGVVLIIGGYQFYFFCQRFQIGRTHYLETPIDSLFKYNPRWVWIYGGIYYIVIFYGILIVPDMRAFGYVSFSYLSLLGAQMFFFILFPVTTPQNWRRSTKNTTSEQFLLLLQRFDGPTNCFPSMHVSMAVLTALHISDIRPEMFPWILAFPILIAMSALFVKQHYVADILPGALLGWLTFAGYKLIPI